MAQGVRTPVVLLEQAALLSGRDTVARVGHVDMQVVALFAQRHPNRPARRAMPIRVGQQVAQRDAQHARVAQQDVFARTIDALDAARRKLAVQIRQQRQQVTLRQAQFRAGFAHAVMGQVFVDERQQAHGRIADNPAARQAFHDGRGQIAAQ
ncbi:hypothetical protein G6F57_020798 [Rhizopus arrhizus]|nr:hypothetical protein G6F57_020798 [Rhizopus arrhizus]